MNFNQKDYQTLIFASFLHDFGKCIQRSSSFPGISHEELSSIFTSILNIKNRTLEKEIDFKRAEEIIEKSHQESDDYLTKVLKKADAFASKIERETIESNQKPTEVNIRSIFPYIKKKDNGSSKLPIDYFYKVSSIYNLEDEYFFAKKKEDFLSHENERDYRSLLSKENLGFLIKEPLEKIDFDFLNLMSFLDEVFYFLLTSIPEDRRDLYYFSNLYDHSKLTTIFTQSFYFESKSIIYLKFDIAGIQKFIYKTKTKNAAKILRGRSLFLQLLNDLITFYLLNHKNLKRVILLQNQLINFGGNTVFLLPETDQINKEVLLSIIKSFTLDLLKNFGLTLRFNLSVLSINNINNPNYFKKDFLNALFQPVKPHDDLIFEIEALNKDEYMFLDSEICDYCLTYKGTKNEDGENICYQCDFFKNLSFHFKEERDVLVYEKKDGWKENDVFPLFGDYYLGFDKGLKDAVFFLKPYEKIIKKSQNKKETLFYSYPSKTVFYDIFVPAEEDGKTIDFEKLSKKGEGANLLALIKGDVDNMGEIVKSIFEPKYPLLETNKSKQKIAQYLGFARKTNLFFQAYLPKLIEKEFQNNKDKAYYMIYSGGDDFVLVTHWSNVFDFIFKLNEKFKKLTCNNEQMSFSVGISLFKDHEPLIKVVEKAEEKLKKAKIFKNRAAFLDSVLTIDDWRKIYDLSSQFKVFGDDIPTSFYYKIYQLADGLSEEDEYKNNLSINMMRYFFLRNFESYEKNIKEEKKDDFDSLKKTLRLIFGLDKDEEKKDEIDFLRKNLKTLMEIIILSRRERG